MTAGKPAEKTIYVKLFMGEKDGWDAEIQTIDGTFPRMFYVHRNCDDHRIKVAANTDAEIYEILSNSLAILAYEFKQADPKEGVTGGRQYRYDRCESADLSLHDPAC